MQIECLTYGKKQILEVVLTFKLLEYV